MSAVEEGKRARTMRARCRPVAIEDGCSVAGRERLFLRNAHSVRLVTGFPRRVSFSQSAPYPIDNCSRKEKRHQTRNEPRGPGCDAAAEPEPERDGAEREGAVAFAHRPVITAGGAGEWAE